MAELIPNYFKPEIENPSREFLIHQLFLNSASRTIKQLEELSDEKLFALYNMVYDYKNFIWWYLIHHPEELLARMRANNLSFDEVKENIRKMRVRRNPKWIKLFQEFLESEPVLNSDEKLIKRITEIINETLYSDIDTDLKIEEIIRYIMKVNDFFYKKKTDQNLIIKVVDLDTLNTIEAWTMSRNFIRRIIEVLNKYIKGEIVQEVLHGSDTDFVFNIEHSEKVRFEFEIVEKKKISKGGSFFNYINKTDLDLSFLQIYREDQLEDLEIENCLLYSLRECGISNDKIESLKSSIFTDYVPKRDLTNVANIINTNITLHVLEGTRNRKREFNNTATDKAEIVIYKSHYFKNQIVPITSFAIKNYNNIKHLSNWNFIINNSNKRNKSRCLSAHKAIPLMFDNGLFGTSRLLNKFEQSNYVEKNDIDYLDDIEEEQIEFKATRKPKNNYDVFYADFETIGKKNRKQTAFTVGYYHPRTDSLNTFYNYSEEELDKNIALYKMLDEIIEKKNNNKLLIYFHNLKFDFNFIEKYLTCSSIVKKGGAIWSVKTLYKKVKIEFRDSFKMISTKLANFQKDFELEEGKKEFIAYRFFNRETITQRTTSLEKYWEKLLKENKKANYNEFLETTKQFHKISSNGNIRLRHMDLIDDYLRFDCITLAKGFEKFRELIKEDLDLEVFDYLSSASLADAYIIKQGCYNGVFEIKGNLRNFVMKAMCGGRTATRNNQKMIVLRKLSDFDACSLYPSAMARLIEEGLGFPTGKATRINSNVDLLDGAYRILKINVLSVNKKQQIPFINKLTDNGRLYDNNITGILYVDSITLQDYIEFHEIEYEIIDGVEWTTFNPKISETIRYLYNHRVELKKQKKNILQNIYKLIMNSAYGKTLLKPSKYSYKYIPESKLNNFISNNFNEIVSAIKCGPKYRIKMYANRYFESNRAHCGVMVLSMSKRIMNEVMNIANDNNINIYYQDTDSMHIDYEKVEILGDLFREKYNRELIGNNMSQFHNDLDLNGKDAFSTLCIILGKKCYIDKIENLDGESGYHIRMKGVGSGVVERYCEDNDTDPINVYMELLRNKELSFDLCKGGIKFNQKESSISLKSSFIRKIKFEGDYEVFEN